MFHLKRTNLPVLYSIWEKNNMIFYEPTNPKGQEKYKTILLIPSFEFEVWYSNPKPNHESLWHRNAPLFQVDLELNFFFSPPHV